MGALSVSNNERGEAVPVFWGYSSDCVFWMEVVEYKSDKSGEGMLEIISLYLCCRVVAWSLRRILLSCQQLRPNDYVRHRNTMNVFRLTPGKFINQVWLFEIVCFGYNSNKSGEGLLEISLFWCCRVAVWSSWRILLRRQQFRPHDFVHMICSPPQHYECV